MAAAQGEETLCEVGEPGIGGAPVDPGQFVVLAIGIVVALLAAPQFVPGEQHGHALGEGERGEQRALQLAAQRAHGRIVAITFHAAIDAAVVVVAIGVGLAICLVVLALVGHQVGQGEAIVRRDEVDAGLRSATGVAKEVARARDARGEFPAAGGTSEPEAARRITEAVVPLAQAGRKASGFTSGHVPGLGDELGGAEHRILAQGVEEGAARIKAA